VVALSPAVLVAAPADQHIFEGFEELPDTTVGVPFQIGPSGQRAEFGGNAYAGEAGSLARSGTRAWLVVNAASDGTITFLDAPASQVEFYADVGSNPHGMIIRAYDPVGALIGSEVLDPGAGSVLVSFNGPVEGIDVTNGAAGDLVSIDDFGYTVVPEPGTGLLQLTAMLVVAGLSRRRA
jgi:hypothetical protein